MAFADQLQICFVSDPSESGEISQLVELLSGMGTVLGVDTETTGLDPREDRVRLVQVAAGDLALVVDLDAFREGGQRLVDWSREGLADLRGLLESSRTKTLQNAAFDLNFLLGEGIELGGPIFDTMIAAKIVNNGHKHKNDLGSIVERELGFALPKDLQKADWSGAISEEMVLYSARDAWCLPQLVGPLKTKLQKSRIGEVTLYDVFVLETQCLRPVARMQWHGFGFSRERAEALRAALEAKSAGLMQEFLEGLQERLKAKHPGEPGRWLPLDADGSFNTRVKDTGAVRLGTKRYAGFNPRSPQQVIEKFKDAGIVLKINEKGKESLDQNLLAFTRGDSPIIDMYLKWKESATLVSHVEKLVDSVGSDGRIHANYRQMGTDTGRLSCIAEGQRVLAPNGPVPIEDVQIGDYVYSLDSDGAPCIKRVTNKWCNGEQDVVCVTWEAKGHQDPMYGELVCTPDHLLRTDRGWVKAEDIQFKEPVWHLRRSAPVGMRPRLYWRNYGYAAEQAVIKESYFGAVGSEWHIHHIDHDKTNNALTNLQIMSRAEHFSHHGKSRHPHWLFTDEARAKSKANNTPKYGPENPVWINASRYSLLRMLAEARGRITYVPMDFDTYKRKCTLAGLDLKALSRRYGAHGLYLNKRNVEEAYRLTGNTEVASKMLGIGTRRINELMLEYGIKRSNHRVINVAPAGKRLVYDLEIEDTHNFIVEELCVHNCAGPNLQQVPKEKEFRSLFEAQPGWKIVVADFSQVELRVAAELSGEPRMLEAYRAGRDLHTETAALMARVEHDKVTKEQRSSAKVCFSGDTEVLTPQGWVQLSAYQGGPVAQYCLPAGVELNRSVKKPGPGYVAGLPPAWDGNCGLIEFVDPIHYDSFESDDVWRHYDRNTDIVATGNHQIFYIDAYGNTIKKPFVDVVNPRLFVAAGYLERGIGIGELRSRLLAMVVADGSFKQTKGWVSLGFSKRRKIFRCENLLDDCGISYSKNKYSNGENQPTTMFKFKLEEAPWLLDYVNVDKELNYNCINDVDALAYLAEAQYWDGISIEGSKRDRVIVGTTVKQTADVMQAMAVTSGVPCTVHTEYLEQLSDGLFYRVSYAFRTSPTWRPTWEPFKAANQEVFCVQVPSELILIRRNGKVCVQGNCNFGLLYGAGAATLRKQSVAQYGIHISVKEAQVLVNQFRQAYPRLYEWQVEQGEGTTTSVFTRYGRRRILVGFNDKFTTRINTQVQGTAGDIAKIAIAKLWAQLRSREEEARLIAMVHDEIVLEVRENVVDIWGARLKKAMEDAGAVVCREVPIVAEVDSGDTWADAK